MGSPNAKRRFVLHVTLIGLGLAVCGWQAEEHVRFKRNASQALINRGRDITDTLGVVVRSQRRFGPFVTKERLEPALRNMIRPNDRPNERPNDLEAIAILSASGETVARAGEKIELTPDEMLPVQGVFWSERTLTLMNLMDIAEDGTRPRPIIVQDETARNPRQFGNRFPQPADAASDPGTAATATGTPPASGPPATPETRVPFGRAMTSEQFDAVIKKQGVQSIVISLSTAEMHRAVDADLLLRSLVSLLAMGGAVISSLAWRNSGKNSELQIRLVKAGEMNTHLKEMNLAAAGLAHETRNPLNIIRGMAQMIAMEARKTPKLKEHASIIVEEADRVTVQLNEFINYSKPRDAHLGPVDVQRLVADVGRTLVPDLEEKQIQVQLPESPLMIEADEQLLRQAIFNVLLNAVQAVAVQGQVKVRLKSVGSRGAELLICDDGPGVPPADRISIFRPYITMRPKGVGLGLAIVAQIAAVHHWEVTCEANEPHGACFRFTGLKIAAAAA